MIDASEPCGDRDDLTILAALNDHLTSSRVFPAQSTVYEVRRSLGGRMLTFGIDVPRGDGGTAYVVSVIAGPKRLWRLRRRGA